MSRPRLTEVRASAQTPPNWFDLAVKEDLLRWRKRLILLQLSEYEDPFDRGDYGETCERSARAAALAQAEIAELPVLPVPPVCPPRRVAFGKGTVACKTPEGAVARCGDSESTTVVFLGEEGRLLSGWRAMGDHGENWAGLIARADLDREYARLRDSTRRRVTPLAARPSAAAATHAAVFGGSAGGAGNPWDGIPEYAEWFERCAAEESARKVVFERNYRQREIAKTRDALQRAEDGGNWDPGVVAFYRKELAKLEAQTAA